MTTSLQQLNVCLSRDRLTFKAPTGYVMNVSGRTGSVSFVVQYAYSETNLAACVKVSYNNDVIHCSTIQSCTCNDLVSPYSVNTHVYDTSI
jgi:hypothetical protein